MHIMFGYELSDEYIDLKKKMWKNACEIASTIRPSTHISA
ncbi:hypothetical protein BN969_1170 [Staphylococcus aureus]|nr:hypothetical protein BN969_1170 [Staphylococcus aureus]